MEILTNFRMVSFSKGFPYLVSNARRLQALYLSDTSLYDEIFEPSKMFVTYIHRKYCLERCSKSLFEKTKP